MTDAAEPLTRGLTARGGVCGGAVPASAVYGVRDGVVVVAALEPHFRQRLYAALDLPLGAPLADVMRMRTCAERTAVAATCDLPVVAVSATLCGPPAIAIVNTRD